MNWVGNDLVVVRAIGALLDAGVLALVADLDAHHGVHVEPRQLPGLDHSQAHLEVLSLERGLHHLGHLQPAGRVVSVQVQPNNNRVV